MAKPVQTARIEPSELGVSVNELEEVLSDLHACWPDGKRPDGYSTNQNEERFRLAVASIEEATGRLRRLLKILS